MKTFILLLICHTLAFNLAQSQTNINITQPATDVVKVCQGDSVTLRCRAVFNNRLTVAEWNRNDTGVNAQNMTQNHFFSFDSDGQGLTDLIIINIGLDDNNTLYTCTDSNIPNNDSVLLLVEGIPSTPGDITINTSCLSAITSWDQVTSNSICGPVSYDVTVLPSDGVAMMRITDTSYMYTNLKSDNNYTVTVAGRNNAGVGNSATGFFSVVGAPLPNGNLTITEAGCLSYNLSWDPFTSDQVCGSLSYDVTIKPSDGVTMMRITNTSYNLAGLSHNTIYSINVVGINDAGMQKINDFILRTPGALIADNQSTSDEITIVLGNGDSLYCGGVMNYSARISPTSLTSPQSECSQTSCTFSDLICETTYNITIEATYRETATTASDSTTITTGECDGDDDFWPIPGSPIVIACILILILLMDCGCYYYIYVKVKSGSEPHSIIVIVFVIFTAGIGWVLYKYLTKTKGPSKIGMQDTEKTPSPDNEPVAYATTETDKVTFGTGGITYADIEIEKGPAAPGSIFPQDKPTYGQVKPSN